MLAVRGISNTQIISKTAEVEEFHIKFAQGHSARAGQDFGGAPGLVSKENKTLAAAQDAEQTRERFRIALLIC
jgi:hypothetical protein